MAMYTVKCKMCGGQLNITDDAKITECDYCGSAQTLPSFDNEKKGNLFNRANNLRLGKEFDKAAGIFESIVAEFPEESEAYWGLCLCKYGIEYVDDPNTGKKIPTCHRTLTTSIMDDSDFELAFENADILSKNLYREEAKAIDIIQKQILEVVSKEDPYDVFICYKETDDVTHQRTEDSTIAQDIYTELVKEGYKVFFSRVTLREKAGTEYEPYIYAALSSAKVMLAIGTKFEYYDAVWVKNEWSRYLAMMAQSQDKVLIPCYKNIDAYDMPKQFGSIQALDMGDISFFKNLNAIISSTAHEKNAKPSQTAKDNPTQNLRERIALFLEDKDWEQANLYCDKLLDATPQNAYGYLFKLLAKYRISHLEELKNCDIKYEQDTLFKRAVLYADTSLKNELMSYVNMAHELLNKKIEKYKKMRQQSSFFENKISLTKEQFFAIDENGTLLFAGNPPYESDFFSLSHSSYPSDMCSVFSNYNDHVIGIDNEGYLSWIGYKNSNWCDFGDGADIVDVGFGCNLITLLKEDGTIWVTAYYFDYVFDSWKNKIKKISCGDGHIVALNDDGTVDATGRNDCGQCNVSDWNDVVSISTSYRHTVALKSDGTVIACGDNGENQCDVESWTDIVKVVAETSATIGLKSNGDIIIAGGLSGGTKLGMLSWHNIVDFSYDNGVLIGLKEDRTALAYTDYHHGKSACNVKGWRNLVYVKTNGYHTIGITNDGRLYHCGSDDLDLSNIRLFNNLETYIAKQNALKNEANERKALQREEDERQRKKELLLGERRNKGVCQYCGEQFVGWLFKKCSNCGKSKDY